MQKRTSTYKWLFDAGMTAELNYYYYYYYYYYYISRTLGTK